MRAMKWIAPAVAVLGGVLAACSSDPTESALIKSLGPEQPGVDQGEYHRAGQPCLVCHQESGPAHSVFAVAGTIFWGKPEDKAVGVENVEVRIVDATGSTRIAKTNCVGNFIIDKVQVRNDVAPWDPQFPLKVAISKGGVDRGMSSLIHRDGSCAGCHRIPAGLDSVGHIFMSDTNQNAPPAPQCAVSPIVPIFSN